MLASTTELVLQCTAPLLLAMAPLRAAVALLIALLLLAASQTQAEVLSALQTALEERKPER